MERKQQRLIFGLVIGALFGVILAWIATNRDEPDNSAVARLKPGDWVKLGISLLGVARQMSELIEAV